MTSIALAEFDGIIEDRTPVEYRLGHRGGQLVLQVLYKKLDLKLDGGRKFSYAWEDLPTVDLNADPA